MRRWYVLFILLVVCLPVEATFLANHPLLIMNADDDEGLPRNFRRSTDYLMDTSADLTGLSELLMSGSGQFSVAQFDTMIDTLGEIVYVVDLRQESHAFVNNYAVSWYSLHNWANVGKTNQEVDADEQKRIADLNDDRWVFIASKDDVENPTAVAPMLLQPETQSVEATWFPKPKIAIVDYAHDEAELASFYHVRYRRFYVTDHRRPTDKQVDAFIEFAHQLHSGDWLHFHCAAGRGRTTTFMVMYDMLKNAKQVHFADIIQRQIDLGGMDLSHMPLKTSYKRKYAEARYQFLQNFYVYAKNNNGETWQEWVDNHHLEPY